MAPKVVILSGEGINAGAELAEAFRLAGAAPSFVPARDLAAEPGLLDGAAILAFPGGFSWGDHLGSGRVLALLLRQRAKPALEAFVDRGGLVLGICNGFQALVKTGLLPGLSLSPETAAEGRWARELSLVHNASGRFLDDWTPVRFEAGSPCLWTAGLEPRLLPIRHGEGRFVGRSPAVLDALEARGLVALRYAPGPGESNPNGSERDIAGICDPSGRILGLMPHPEASLIPENQPGRRRGRSEPTGLELFERGVAAARAAS